MTINAYVQPDFKENIAKDKPKHAQIIHAKMVPLVLTTPTSWAEASSAMLSTLAIVPPDSLESIVRTKCA